MKKHLLLLPFTLTFLLIHAQDLPFTKGVNLTNWLQVDNARAISYRKYTKTDFEQIQSLGCDVIRLPINLHFMTDGAPNYKLDPIFLEVLDMTIDWAEELNLHLIIDNHTFDPAEDTHPNIGQILEKVWSQMAEQYKNSYENIYFEILNEPHGISNEQWNAIQQSVVTTIRAIDTTHTLIIGPADWNTYHSLAQMPVYEDEKLIYTFHFYDPFLLTHQGATWTGPSLAELSGIPFPYSASEMPTLPQSFEGAWVEAAFNNYANEGNAEYVKSLLDIAISFRDERNIPLFCGEFGVYQPNSQNEDRVRWYKIVSDYLTENNIAWTTWDYHGGFGLFNPGPTELFEHDLNIELLEAIGFNQPEQSPFIPKTDSSGFIIYDDYVGKNINSYASSSTGLDLFYENQPRTDRYAIHWSNAQQYEALSFDFQPDRDLAYLNTSGYYVEFYAKSSQQGFTFDIRFVDTQTDAPEDKPWRNRYTIDDSLLPKDGQWHKLIIPLTEFEEHGAWDGQWHTPRGDFDWKAISNFDFVAEYGPLNSALLLDQIQISSTVVQNRNPYKLLDFKLQPNPVNDYLFIDHNENAPIEIEIIDQLGRRTKYTRLEKGQLLNIQQLLPGSYNLRLRTQKGAIGIGKFIKN